MAIKFENDGELNFGNAGAQVVITHGRVKKTGANNNTRVVRPLSSPITIPSGQPIKIADGDIDLVFPTGQLISTDDHKFMAAVVTAYLAATSSIEVDLMTSTTAVISVSGYSMQTHTAWTVTEEAD